MTPEQLATAITDQYLLYEYMDERKIIADIAQAIRDAYERAAKTTEILAEDYDGQALAVLDCAAHAIRTLKDEQ